MKFTRIVEEILQVWGIHYAVEGLPSGSGVKNLPANAGDVRDMDSIPGWERSPGGGHGNPHQSVFLPGAAHGQRAWWVIVHGVAKS